ncbi:hypothetical protein EU96_1561 [Prochlorococcus marinus str. MIT 9302]|uniref:Prolyl 4-hydroxylase alpha subunit Fe(2+) 2OG dioxygenase domain-containing protein n=1 Tax=Prochlorococcus marinus str. MIT 9302 TaxID=74545 RepID=A0A0A2A4V0_PROMR|nr:2OG-Fe(II) oxygenase [Prochlorococcus marinus]KGF96922.1 hypothetical protein EU96_1561 [Prochlorococcus marinus str. MIT 9302]
MNRKEIASLIVKRIEEISIKQLQNQYRDSSKINHIVIDDLLPSEIALKLDDHFPEKQNLSLLSGPQERKYVAVDWESKSKLVEECLYAFQDERIITIISKVCQIDDLYGDPELYAGGLSYMNKGCFLNPHIDNSHDRLREKYRRLNLLYYVSTSLSKISDGGDLLLFPDGLKFDEIKIPAKFNRLVIMRTDNKSIHAVNPIQSSIAIRKCISNYYFSLSSPLSHDYYHSTSFRGFRGEKYKDLYLRLNAKLRTSIKSISGNLFGRFISTGHHRKIKK